MCWGEDVIQEDTFPSHLQAQPSLPILAQGTEILLRAEFTIQGFPHPGSCSGCGKCVGWAEDGWDVLCQGTTSNHGENQLDPTEFYAGVITSSGHGGYF